MIKACEHCGNDFEVPKWRFESAKFCSRACSDSSKVGKPNTVCTSCGKNFHMKPSQKNRYQRKLGYFCSNICAANNKKDSYFGSRNPNYKAKNVDSDGYRIYVPSARTIGSICRMKLHQAVCCEVLGIDRIPKWLHVHHRDCDMHNNVASNLVVLDASSHKWLHKQFGIATLWAYCNGRIRLDELVSWSDDHEMARRLLPMTVLDQTAIVEDGIVKIT